ncbi:RecB family exonuclease [Boudabousia liubingyangii]|nr:PD-(D/E)XK nuclease family protein [Boudabousia liubingyangii]
MPADTETVMVSDMEESAKTVHNPTLSYSRLKEFKQCPLRYQLSMVNRIPQPPQMHLAFGTAVHQVLENLYALPRPERTHEAALADIPEAFRFTMDEHPEYEELFETEAEKEELQGRIRTVIDKYFLIENPSLLINAGRELEVQAVTDEGVNIRGFIDRIDRNPNDGSLRVVDYKTGKMPRPQYQQDALDQLRFYALLLTKAKKQTPARTQLVYLEAQQILPLDPQGHDLYGIEKTINQTWTRIEEALNKRYFTTRKGPLCTWCPFQEYCPEFGGKTPEMPEDRIEYLLQIRSQD